MSTRPNVTEELERLIDATSLLDVMTGLILVCTEKALAFMWWNYSEAAS